MSTSSFDTAALWSATTLATDQNKIGAAGLSVRQRKLLTLLSQPMSVSQLASSIALPVEEVHAALDRFARLGLVQSGEPAPLDPMQLRATSGMNAAANESPSRMPMMIGIAVAALALVAAAAWMLRGGSPVSSPAQTQVASNAAPATPKAPTPTGSADSADTVLPKSAAVVPAPVAAPAPTPTAPATTPPNAAAARSAAALAAATPVVTAPAVPTKSASATPAATSAVAPTTVAATPAATNAAPASATAATALAPSTVPAQAAATAAPPIAVPAPAPIAATPVVVAAAAPTVATPARAAPAPTREIKLITRVEPLFPRGSDTDKGTVRARLQVDARGTVTGVEILEANPPRVFDRTVRTALQQWRYEPTGESFTTLAEISFNR